MRPGRNRVPRKLILKGKSDPDRSMADSPRWRQCSLDAERYRVASPTPRAQRSAANASAVELPATLPSRRAWIPSLDTSAPRPSRLWRAGRSSKKGAPRGSLELRASDAGRVSIKKPDSGPRSAPNPGASEDRVRPHAGCQTVRALVERRVSLPRATDTYPWESGSGFRKLTLGGPV